MKFGPGEGLARKRPRGSARCLADRAVKHRHLPGKDFRMLRRRSLALALTTAGTLAVAAPAADAVTNTTLTFCGGTVQVVGQGPAANTVRFTIRAASPATTRVFVDIHGLGHSRIALGTPAALGVPHAVYNDVSTDGCQVYTGTTFGEADELPTTDGSTVFDIRKDELAPDIAIAIDDSAGG